ncbi:dTDP-4-dehydrorhamnose 3,5-epimerase family protein [Streptomyces sp. NPDC052040]|uniref:dTDP-4-dehydrorhamnose 3,5-epimerase family protein n=1 Tax=Streptomyces sp. NPDC052040 TaxID=3365682 RepID=UPI0037D2893B
MKARPLTLPGAFEVIPDRHRDKRGVFLEWFRADWLREATGHTLNVAQVNLSVSTLGAIRGLHLTRTPPGQAKYVSCMSGAIVDVLVDLRLGSPTFGQHESVRLDATEQHSVYVPEGFGHGFCALTEGATVSYLCSTSYAPEIEYVLNPLDPELGISWPVADPIPSDIAAQGRGLRECLDEQLLPTYDECRALAQAHPGRPT